MLSEEDISVPACSLSRCWKQPPPAGKVSSFHCCDPALQSTHKLLLSQHWMLSSTKRSEGIVDAKSKICVTGSKEDDKKKDKGFLAYSFPFARWFDLKYSEYLALLRRWANLFFCRWQLPQFIRYSHYVSSSVCGVETRQSGLGSESSWMFSLGAIHGRSGWKEVADSKPRSFSHRKSWPFLQGSEPNLPSHSCLWAESQRFSTLPYNLSCAKVLHHL